jgi:hypothetical protein
VKISLPSSVGDFMDRLSILEIKRDKGLEVSTEISGFEEIQSLFGQRGFDYYLKILKTVHESLWDLEDIKRTEVSRYTDDYSDVSTLITQLNDLRHQTKKRIDEYFNSEFTEKKSHKE